MGNASSSKDRQGEETVDFGYLTPQGGIYPAAQRDWNQPIVAQLIVHRKLAPFYRPLEDYEEDWDDEQILAAQKKPSSANAQQDGSSSSAMMNDDAGSIASGGSGSGSHAHLSSATSALRHAAGKSSSKSSSAPHKEVLDRSLEARLYRGAVDCPICFLYYPSHINQTRCCDQVICTECFVHIKRADPTTTHLVSEPACCPYCMQSNFGVIYAPPNWRAGIGADGSANSRPDFATHSSSGSNASGASTEMGVSEGKRRRKSVSHTSQDVVTIDQIRPDWEAKLNAVRAQVARRANRRIVMRQVGDQLIPVGITSGRVVALPPGTQGTVVVDESNGGRRRRRDRNGGTDGNGAGFGQFMGMTGPDIEELMIMEAMRLSMVEENERIRRQQETERNANNGEASSSNAAPTNNVAAPLVIPPSSSDPAAVVSSYRVPASSRPGEADLPTSSSLPLSSHLQEEPPSPPGRRSFDPSVHPSSTAIGGATASLAMALGSPSVQSQAGLVGRSEDGSRTVPQGRSALSALLSATNTASAILGARSPPDNVVAQSLVPETASPRPHAQREDSASSAADIHIPALAPEIIYPHHETEPSGTITPTNRPLERTSQSSTPPPPPPQPIPVPAPVSEVSTQCHPPVAPVSSDPTASDIPVSDSPGTSRRNLQQATPSHLGYPEPSPAMMTPRSINSEAAEEYDFLPDSPAGSEGEGHLPLIDHSAEGGADTSRNDSLNADGIGDTESFLSESTMDEVVRERDEERRTPSPVL